MKKLFVMIIALGLASAFVGSTALAECTGNEAVKAKCSNSGSKGGNAKVSIKGGEGGATATLDFDNGALIETITLKKSGKGKAKVKGLAEGSHSVTYVECGISADFECK